MRQAATVGEAPSELSVVIPSFGHRAHLGCIIRELLAQDPAVREIIVSHSGPGDPASLIPPRGRVPIVLLHSPVPLSSGAARNAGASVAQGRWLAFVDDDVIPARQWSRELTQAVMRRREACHVGGIGVDVTGGYWGMCLWFAEFGSVHPYMPERPIEGGASANMFLSRALYEKVGGFSAELTRSVDVEFLARCRGVGAATIFVPDVVVSHRNIGGFAHCLRHAYRLGAGSAKVRRITPLRGELAVRWPLLAPFLAPARLAMILYRIARWGRGVRRWGALCYPGLVVTITAWTLAFFLQAVGSDAARSETTRD